MKATIVIGRPLSTDLTREELRDEWIRHMDTVEGTDYGIVLPEGRLDPAAMSQAVPEDTEALFGIPVSEHYITRDFLDSHPKLRYIAGLSHGFGDVDFEMTAARGITITNTAYGEHTIAEYAFALLLSLCHRTELHSNHVKSQAWWEPDAPPFMQTFSPQIELYGKTMGIVGLGKIGKSTAGIARGFAMRVIAGAPRVEDIDECEGVERMTLDEMYAQSDVISVHVPDTPSTRGMFNAEAFSKMKDGVIFINTARGALVDEEALADALDSGKVAMAGLDVLANEPPIAPSRLLSHPNAMITGHIAWLPKTSRLRQVSLATSNYLAYLEGHPVSVVG